MRVRDPLTVPTLYSATTPRAGASLSLGEDAASHLRVLRMHPGGSLRITDGKGTVGTATLHRLGRDGAQVDVDSIEEVERYPELHVIVPVSDKDRMLWAAEKCVELSVTSWRPTTWKRSRSVASRGEGAGFQRRLQARMIAALEQSGGAWLPDVFPEANVDRSIAAASQGSLLVLSPEADANFPAALPAPVTVVIGPEGGMETSEVDAYVSAGFRPVRIPGGVLRFETAVVAAAALSRAAMDNHRQQLAQPTQRG